MNKFFSFFINKLDPKNLNFLYLRVGKTSLMYEKLTNYGNSLDIKIVKEEVENFKNYHISKLTNYNGLIINLSIEETDLKSIRKDFWENFMWKLNEFQIPFALVIPNSNQYGSLTKGQIFESLSLIRLTDRIFEIFEQNENVEKEVIDWLTNICSIAFRKEFEIKENN